MPSPVRSVGLNALFLDPGGSGGPETYLRQLAPALADEFPSVHFSVVTTLKGAAALRQDGWSHRFSIHALPADEYQRGRRQFAEQILLPLLARSRRWDVLHSLASVAPIRTPIPSVITLHDVTFMRLRTFSAVTTFGMRQVIQRAARNANALLTGSAAARDEICDVLGLTTERFRVVPHGAGRLPNAEATSEEEVRSRYGLDGAEVILCVGAKRPHKNQGLLLSALRGLSSDLILVLAGRPEPYDAELRDLARKLHLGDRTRFVDYIPDTDMEGLWHLAACAAFPTLGEGFGLPVLEAMQRGVPVVCSDIPVLREVGAEVPHYFDPHDPAAAARAIQAALVDPDAGPSGVARAAQFSWAEAARGTFEAYERAMAS